MAKLYVEEYKNVRRDDDGNLCDVPHISMGRTQVTYTSTSARTTFAFDQHTSFVVLYSDTDSMVVLGDSTVTADQNSFILPAGVFRTFGVSKGFTHVAAIEKT